MFEKGFFKASVAPPEAIKAALEAKDWCQVDHLCAELVKPGGALYELLWPIAKQSKIEYIISVRDASNSWEEDGIWHDDGSRILAFSMGLNLSADEIEGGTLLLRKKGEKLSEQIPPPSFGETIVFKTGVENYEHKVLKVNKSVRVVMAGWCYP